MNYLPPASGLRKGKHTSWKQLLSSLAGNTLRIFPIPGLDVLRAQGFNPHQKGISIAAAPKHANIVLVADPLPEILISFVANVYAQMPRPRLLVWVGLEAKASLPFSGLYISADELNSLKQKIIFNHVWSQDATTYEPPSMKEGMHMYTCPMHPEVQSDKPGKCPKCGMALVMKGEEEAPMHMQHQESNDKNDGHGDKPKEHFEKQSQHTHHHDDRKKGEEHIQHNQTHQHHTHQNSTRRSR